MTAPDSTPTEREAGDVGEPRVLRVPLNRTGNPDGQRLNSGIDHIDVPIVIDPDLPVRGETRRDHGYSTTDTSIVLREWNEQVLLHELLHVLLDGRVPTSIKDPHGHDIISRLEVALWETGWRFTPAADDREAGDVREVAVVKVLIRHGLRPRYAHTLAAALAPLIAEREQAAIEKARYWKGRATEIEAKVARVEALADELERDAARSRWLAARGLSHMNEQLAFMAAEGHERCATDLRAALAPENAQDAP